MSTNDAGLVAAEGARASAVLREAYCEELAAAYAQLSETHARLSVIFQELVQQKQALVAFILSMEQEIAGLELEVAEDCQAKTDLDNLIAAFAAGLAALGL
jgi:hypothetical protein